jgi:hypothetical protein
LIAAKQADSRLAFKLDPSSVQISAGVDALFTNAKPKPSPTGCGAISECGIYQADCATALSTEAQTYVSMASAQPWAITQSQNIGSGYEQEICVKCFSATQPKGTSFLWKLSQPDCSNNLVKTGSQQKSVLAPYQDTTNKKTIIAAWTDVFKNTNSECPAATKCELLE